MTTTGGYFGTDCPDLGEGYLKIGEQLKQIRLKFFVGPVELIDEEHRPGPERSGLDGAEQRPRSQVFPAHDVGNLGIGRLRLSPRSSE